MRNAAALGERYGMSPLAILALDPVDALLLHACGEASVEADKRAAARHKTAARK